MLRAMSAARRIFVSYRRSDGAMAAGRLRDELVERGEGEVFLDVSSIKAGQDFEERINSEIRSSDVLLVIIGRNWLESLPGGSPRIQQPLDWVRLEVEAAVHHGVPLLPVLIDGAGMPSAELLPESVRVLTRLHAAELSAKRWTKDVEELVECLPGPRISRPASPGGRTASAQASAPGSTDRGADVTPQSMAGVAQDADPRRPSPRGATVTGHRSDEIEIAATGRAIASFSGDDRRVHVLRCTDGRLVDHQVAAGRLRPVGVRADEAVLTPRHKVLAVLHREQVALCALGSDGRLTPLPKQPQTVPGSRRLLAARVIARNVVEVLVTTDTATLLVVLPGGRVSAEWPFVAPAGVGTDTTILLWTPSPATDEDFASDPRVMPGSALRADAASVGPGLCLACVTLREAEVSWETTNGPERRVLPGEWRSVAVVRSFAAQPEPTLVLGRADGDFEVVAWSGLPHQQPTAAR
jgi:hypothetical protein